MIGSRWKAVGLAVLLAEPVLAAVTPDQSLVLDRWELQLGGFFTRIDTRLRLNEIEDRPPAEVNFEDDLGFDNADNLFRFSISRILAKRHEIRFTYFELDRDSQFTVETELDDGDETIPIDVEGTGIFDTELGVVDYTFWVLAKEKTAFGLTAGLTLFDLKVGVDADAPDLEELVLQVETEVPVPQLGLRVRQALTPKLVFLAEGALLRFRDISDVDGDIWSARLGLEHRTFRYLGFGAQVSLYRYDLSTGDRRYNLDFQYDIDGFYFYLRGTFGGPTAATNN